MDLLRKPSKASRPLGGFIALLAIGTLLMMLAAVTSAAADNSSRDIADRLARDQEQLNRSRSEIADIDRRIATAEQYLNQRRVELADAASMLRDAEDSYDATLRLYEGRIAAIYKLGEDRFYETVISSEDFTDGMARAAYLTKVSENDERLVKRVKAEAETVRDLRARVDGLKQAQAEDVNELRLHKQELATRTATDQARIDRQMTELAQARAHEEEEAARRQAEEAAPVDAGNIYSGVMGPSVTVSNEPPAGLQPTGAGISGMASWYGPGFQGNTTANGEIYNMYAYTAAHKSLPFNTWLKVTHNGRSVFVRINDRGPYVGARILDLSYSSAQAIGISGVGFVRAEIYR